MWLPQRPQIFTLIKWAQNFWLMSFLMHSLLIRWHRLQKSKNPNFWLVQVIWLVQDTYPYAAIWLVWDTYPNAAIWLVWDTYHSTCYKRVYFFFIEKKIENCVVGHPTISLISAFFMSPGLMNEYFDMWVGFLVVPWYHFQINCVLQIYTDRRKRIG